MKQPTVQNLSEQKTFIEAEKELKKNVDELMVWLGGTVRYFVRSIKGLSERTNDKDGFRSYVSERLLANTERLSEVADFYMPNATRKHGKQLTDREMLLDIKRSLRGYDVKADDYDELSLFYKNSICGILSENYEEFITMRLHISALDFMSKTCNDYGATLLNYVCDHILRTKDMPIGQRIGTLLCLVMAVMEVDSKLLGDYAESIDTIVDHASITVCMSVTTDFLNSKKKEE